MEEEIIINGIKRSISKETINGVFRDILLKSINPCSLRSFLDSAFAVFEDTFDILWGEGYNFKIFTRLYLGRDSTYICAEKFEEYSIQSVFDQFLDEFEEQADEIYQPGDINIILGVGRYTLENTIQDGESSDSDN